MTGDVRGGDGGDVVIQAGPGGVTIGPGTIKSGDGGDAVVGGVDPVAGLQRLQVLFQRVGDTERAEAAATIEAEIEAPAPDAGKIARLWRVVQAGATINGAITLVVNEIAPAIEAIIAGH
jgi:hypothetical protein